MNLKPTICGVIGNPIEHSLSPEIHANFAKQFNLELDYQKYLLNHDQLNSFVKGFFQKGGSGLNVTLPFKQQLFEVVDELSHAAKICQSVNTLSLTSKGKIKGDTTDGDGLILDLERLSYSFKNQNILVVGAGGASISVIYTLLKNGSNITLHNRSKDKMTQVISQFSEIGKITPFNSETRTEFDGVICATSQFNQSLLQQVVPLIKSDGYIYDLNYAERAKETLNYFRQKGFEKLSDGYGMLLGQAAKSFEIWHGVLPELD